MDEKRFLLEWTAAEQRNLLRAMEETELSIRSICLSGHRKYPLGHQDLAV